MVKNIIPPYEGPPISRLIYRDAIYKQGRYVKTGDTFGYDKTFKDGLWDDTLNWNDLSVWEE